MIVVGVAENIVYDRDVRHVHVHDILRDESVVLNDGKTRVVISGAVLCTGAETFPVAIVKSVFVTVGIAATITRIVRIPSDVAFVIKPGNYARTIFESFKGEPDPAVRAVVAPNSVVVGSPTPRVVRNPSIARIGPGPITVSVRSPAFFVSIRYEVSSATDDYPAALSGQSVIGVKNGVIILRRIGDDGRGRSITPIIKLIVNRDLILRINGITSHRNDEISRCIVWNVKTNAVVIRLKTSTAVTIILRSIALVAVAIIGTPGKFLDRSIFRLVTILIIKHVGRKRDHIARSYRKYGRTIRIHVSVYGRDFYNFCICGCRKP